MNIQPSALQKRIEASSKRAKADLVIKNGKIVNVFTGEIVEADVAITDGMIIGIGAYEGKDVWDAQGKYIAPGFIDGHVHIESSMVTPTQFAEIVLPHGVTSVVCDPHEIANVSGTAGIQYMLDASEGLDLDVYVMLPSCVPATSFEHAGAKLYAKDLAPFYHHPRVLGLAEVMDYPAVMSGSDDMVQKIDDARKRSKKLDGHLAGLSKDAINVYMTAGIRTDHEAVTLQDAKERLQLGMYLLIREGSAAKDLKSLIPVVNERTAARCLFCTDDKHLDDLFKEGSIDYNVRLAIQCGIDPITAIRMATLTAAECYGLAEKGAVAPGYLADLIMMDNLEQVTITDVWKNGKLIAKNGRYEGNISTPANVPATITNSVRITPVTKQELQLPISKKKAHIIGVVPNSIVTEHLVEEVDIANGFFQPSIERDLAKMAVVERHHKTGHIGVGIVKGFGLQSGAMATTIAHDSHNIITVGTNDQDMLTAIKTLEEMQGGLVIVENGKVLASLSLEIAGLMTIRPAERVMAELHHLDKALLSIGASQEFSQFLTLSFLALPVIPALKLTDMGLFDVKQFVHMDVSVDERELVLKG
ncbi:adenine deaminase [Brevibacillus laterosporus]|uniref:Adenine deaminase n=1 Tax=Brevibacillus laterosporus TaxID=1465 RepID=A0A518V2F0_BRELA|nr:adenine deaminase [Brevibacillus laterosporus]